MTGARSKERSMQTRPIDAGPRHGFLALLALTFLPGAAGAAPLKVELEDAADHHVAGQGTYRGGLKDSWEYKMGSRRSAPNITGITAHGLLAAHQLTGLQEHEDAALRAAQSLVDRHDQGWRKRRPYTQDVEFLAAAGQIIDAARWFNVTRGNYTPATYVSFVIEGRKASPQLAGWDLASAIRAAIAVGQLEYGRGILAELVKRRAEWDKPGLGQGLARGSLLWAIAVVRGRLGLTPEQNLLAESLVRELAASQKASGAWQAGDVLCTQTTAYAILGLSRFASGKRAAAAGKRWLRGAARTDTRFFQGGRIWATTYTLGGRPENDYNSEIQSEAMMALAAR
jgi:hypothetical protein